MLNKLPLELLYIIDNILPIKSRLHLRIAFAGGLPHISYVAQAILAANNDIQHYYSTFTRVLAVNVRNRAIVLIRYMESQYGLSRGTLDILYILHRQHIHNTYRVHSKDKNQ